MSTVKTYTPLSRGLIINVLFKFTSMYYDKTATDLLFGIDADGTYSVGFAAEDGGIDGCPVWLMPAGQPPRPRVRLRRPPQNFD